VSELLKQSTHSLFIAATEGSIVSLALSNKVKLLSLTLFPDFWKTTAFGNVPRLRPFAVLGMGKVDEDEYGELMEW